jgi:hypothetical protein
LGRYRDRSVAVFAHTRELREPDRTLRGGYQDADAPLPGDVVEDLPVSRPSLPGTRPHGRGHHRGLTAEGAKGAKGAKGAEGAEGAKGAAEHIETLARRFRGTPNRGLDDLWSCARRRARHPARRCDPVSAWSSAGPGAWSGESVQRMESV